MAIDRKIGTKNIKKKDKMEVNLFNILACFIVYSFLGWIMETVFRSFCEKKIINTGFLIGPACPIYGIRKYNNDYNYWQIAGKNI